MIKMLAGKLVLKLAAVAPILAIAGVGYEAHRPHQPFSFLEYSQVEEKVLESYIPLVQRYEAMIPKDRRPSATEVREFADYWINLKTKPLVPAFQEEISEEGPRNEVMLLWDRTISELEMNAFAEERKGDWRACAEDYLRTLRVVRILKYSDASTMGAANSQQRGVISRIETALPHLTKTEKKELAAELKLASDPEAFHVLADRLQMNAETYTLRAEEADKADGQGPFAAGTSPADQQLQNKAFCARMERHLDAILSEIINKLNS